MLHPYKARVDERRFLNLPGFHGGAYVVAYVEDTSARRPETCGGRSSDIEPRLILEIADCRTGSISTSRSTPPSTARTPSTRSTR